MRVMRKCVMIFLMAAGLSFLTSYALADWSPAKRLTWNSGWSRYPAMAVDSSGTVHVIWSDETPGNYQIYYKRSTDGGTTWDAIRRLTWTSGGSYEAAIAVDSGQAVHIVWYEYTPGNNEIGYKRSTDGGTTWAAVQYLTSTLGGSFSPSIAVDTTGAVHVVWYDDTVGNDEIYYRGSPDGGKTWTAVQRLSWTSGGSEGTAIDSGDALHVVFSDDTPGNYELYHKRSPDGGATWVAKKRLTWNSGSSYSPVLALDSTSNVHVIWFDHTPGNFEVYYRKSPDGGTTWSAMKRLTWNSGGSSNPAMAIGAGDSIHAVWADDTSENYEIYYRRSPDEGTTWNAVQRLTWTSGASSNPAIDIDSSGTIHVVWQDYLTGNYEIYYKKGN